MIAEGPSKNVLNGPILDEAPFPDVLVAKAYSPDGDNLDLVLYPGKESGKFELGFARLKAGQQYSLGRESKKANKDGKASWSVELQDRTELKLVVGS